VGGLPDPGATGDAVEVAVKNRIRDLRTAKGWSQADLAEKLDVSRQSVNAVETGKFDPSLPLAFRIARLFGRKIEDVFDDR
jgi:putative transcriptional regulator